MLRGWMAAAWLLAVSAYPVAADSGQAPAAPAQAESAGVAELRRALDGFLVILAIDPQSGDILKVRSEAGGTEIVRPLSYVDAEAAYVDWLGGGIPEGHAVVAANGFDVIAETQGSAVWIGGSHDAAMGRTRIDQPALFYVVAADGTPVMKNYADGARMPMFVRYVDAVKLMDQAKTGMASADGTPPELSVAHMDLMTTLQAIISGEYVGLRLVSPQANARWAVQNQQGSRSLADYVTDGQMLAQEGAGD